MANNHTVMSIVQQLLCTPRLPQIFSVPNIDQRQIWENPKKLASNWSFSEIDNTEPQDIITQLYIMKGQCACNILKQTICF